MNSDYRITTDALDHPKLIKLKRMHGPECIICLIRLWAFTARYHCRGVLEGCDGIDLEIACQWNGDEGVFLQALVDCRLLDLQDGVYSVHNWELRNGYAFHAPERTAKAKNAASARWGDKQSHKDTGSNARSNAKSNAPAPAPVPSPVPVPKKTLPDKSGDAPKKKRKAAPSDSKTRQITDCYQELYLKKFDKLPAWNGSTGKRTKQLLTDYKDDADRICQAIRNGFDSTDPFIMGLVGSYLQLTGASTIARLDALPEPAGPRRAFGGGAV